MTFLNYSDYQYISCLFNFIKLANFISMFQKKNNLFNSTQPTKRLKSVQQIIQILKNPPKRPKSPPRQAHQVDRQQIKKSMKVKWKGSGYGNGQFNKVPILKAKMLDNWQIARISLSKRSYQFPKDYHGVKFDQHSRQFKQPLTGLYSKKFQDHLKKVQMDYEDHILGVKQSKFSTSNSQVLNPNKIDTFNLHRIKVKTQGSYKSQGSKNYNKNNLPNVTKDVPNIARSQRRNSSIKLMNSVGLKFNCPVDRLFGFPQALNVNFSKRRVKTSLNNKDNKTQQF